MNVSQLELILKESSIPTDVYSFKGGLPNEVFCIANERDCWAVYYSERGNKTGLRVFTSETEACEYFLTWIKRNFKIM